MLCHANPLAAALTFTRYLYHFSARIQCLQRHATLYSFITNVGQFSFVSLLDSVCNRFATETLSNWSSRLQHVPSHILRNSNVRCYHFSITTFTELYSLHQHLCFLNLHTKSAMSACLRDHITWRLQCKLIIERDVIALRRDWSAPICLVAWTVQVFPSLHSCQRKTPYAFNFQIYMCKL